MPSSSDAIDKLAACAPWLTVTYVAGSAWNRPGEHVQVVDRALADGDGRSRHVYVCGSDSMVEGALTGLRQAG